MCTILRLTKFDFFIRLAQMKTGYHGGGNGSKLQIKVFYHPGFVLELIFTY